jgi:hypothetical protein
MIVIFTSISTKFVSLIPAYREVYSIQVNIIKYCEGPRLERVAGEAVSA